MLSHCYHNACITEFSHLKGIHCPHQDGACVSQALELLLDQLSLTRVEGDDADGEVLIPLL